MSYFTGMDIEAVRSLATQLNTKASDIDSLRQQLTSQIESTAWVGADRERFYGDWTGQYTAALNQVAEGLRTAATCATNNANQQETTSNA